MTETLARLSARVDRALLAVSCAFLALMMLHVTFDVALRFLFNAPVVGTLETVSYYYMIIAVFLPLAYVERKGEHIRVDLFVQHLPQGLQLALYLLACLAGLAFFGMLAYQGLLDAWRSTLREETIMSNCLFYIWPSRWALPIGFFAVCLTLVANILTALQKRRAL